MIYGLIITTNAATYVKELDTVKSCAEIFTRKLDNKQMSLNLQEIEANFIGIKMGESGSADEMLFQ